MRFSEILLLLALSVSVFQPAAMAQSEDCTTEPSLDGSDMFGFNPAPTPTADSFAMTAAGCVDFPTTFSPAICVSNAGLDNVVCFTPTNNCDILIQTSSGGLGSSVNIFSGPCQEPTSCIASAASPNPYNSALVFPVSLTAGTQYCVVWERCGSASHGLTINQINATDCGALPIELLSFSVTSEPEEASGPLESGSNNESNSSQVDP